MTRTLSTSRTVSFVLIAFAPLWWYYESFWLSSVPYCRSERSLITRNVRRGDFRWSKSCL